MTSPILLPSGALLPDTPFVPGTVKPEEAYELHGRLGAALGLPCPQTFIKLESVAQDGSLHAHYNERSRTVNRNFWNLLFINMGLLRGNSAGPTSDTTFGAGHMNGKGTTGTVLNANSSGGYSQPYAWANVSSDTQGIVVGTGGAAESYEGFALTTQVLTGNTAGTLLYNAQAIPTPAYNAGTLTWTNAFVRIFNNNSGGTITISETGLYANCGGGSLYAMILRDLLGATVPVLDGGQLTVTITMTLTFPA
jgi:hypothetical protein